MKKLLTILCGLIFSATVTTQVTRTAEGVTFVVDGELPNAGPMSISDGEQMAQFWVEKLAKTDDRSYVASSFRNTPMTSEGEDVLFRTMVEAFAHHYSLVLSPDMIWLNICQVFDHYVNQHAEELRSCFVGHDGQMTLVVQTDQDIFSPEFDWAATIDGFIQQIDQNTKGGIADIIVADFTTTTPTTRIASGATLMDAMKNYYEYIVARMVCGIPSITLTGTPDDWRSVLRRTEALEKYGMKWWTKDLKPILRQFIRASEGKPDVKFWKDIVMRDLPDRLRGADCAGSSIITSFDGWFTKLFPYNKDGNIEDDWSMGSTMLSSMVSVPFRYHELNDATGQVERDIPMNLIAGFVGARVDEEQRVLTPEIGWMVRQAESDESIQAKLQAASEDDFTTLSFRVGQVPEMLRELKHIHSLHLTFVTDNPVLPQWLDEIQIDRFSVSGKITTEQAKQLRKRFPRIRIERE